MTGSTTLERRYRRLLALYPSSFRREREEEMLSVLMAGSREGQRWPRPEEVVNLLSHATASRLREGRPPGRFDRHHPRGVIVTRLLVAVWLVALTVFLCRYTLWALFMLVFVAAHLYLAARTAAFMWDDPNDGEPPSAGPTGG